jgi:hypothetical protein
LRGAVAGGITLAIDGEARRRSAGSDNVLVRNA